MEVAISEFLVINYNVDSAVKLLPEAGTDPQSFSDGDVTSLHFAAARGGYKLIHGETARSTFPNIVTLLFDAGPYLNSNTVDGTPTTRYGPTSYLSNCPFGGFDGANRCTRK